MKHNPDVLQIVNAALTAGGFDGLFSAGGECACAVGDLAPCGEIQGDCETGYRVPCPGEGLRVRHRRLRLSYSEGKAMTKTARDLLGDANRVLDLGNAQAAANQPEAAAASRTAAAIYSAAAQVMSKLEGGADLRPCDRAPRRTRCGKISSGDRPNTTRLVWRTLNPNPETS